MLSRHCGMVVVCSFLSLVGCGRVGYDERAEPMGGLTETVTDADIRTFFDASVSTDAAPTMASFEHIASSSCESPSTSIVVPAGGVAAGSTIIVQVLRLATSGTATVSDSADNAYDEVKATGNAGVRVFQFQSKLTNALQTDDLINITESNPVPSAVIVSQLKNATSEAFSSHDTQAADGNIKIDFTATSPGVVLCSGGIREGKIAISNSWIDLGTVTNDCGGSGELTAFSYWIPAGRDGLSSCEATIELPSGFKTWVGLVHSYGDEL